MRHGHPWIYSNEIDVAATPLRALEPGQQVQVVAARGEPLGVAYANPHSLISARMLAPGARQALGAPDIASRLAAALRRRESLHDSPHYRLVHGESDALPGLVLDRYGDIVVGQIGTAGMERLRPQVEAALAQVLAPAALVWRNVGGVRRLEQLPEQVEAGIGELPERIVVQEGGLSFSIALATAQKTGWFYDQRANRDALARLRRRGRVLDLFAYQGGWGLRAVAAGAERALCVDSSLPSCLAIESHAQANGLADRVDTLHADAFDATRALREDGERFDVVVLDPPAFIKKRKDQREGLLAYRRINQAALRLVADDGLLVTCSCSHHLAEADLLALVHEAATRAGRRLVVLARLQQGPDHPVLPVLPESAYLKGLICAVD